LFVFHYYVLDDCCVLTSVSLISMLLEMQGTFECIHMYEQRKQLC